jgi:antitoxin MazE
MAMLVSKWGDSLAVRLSAEDVARLGVKEGDEVEVKRAATPTLPESDEVVMARRELALERLRSFRGTLPADFKFDRDEANER